MKLLLQKNIINHYCKNVKQRFSTEKKIIKNLFLVKEKKLGRFQIKSENAWMANIKQMFTVEFLGNSAVVCIVTLCFEHAEHLHSSHFTYHLRYYVIIDHSWKLLILNINYSSTM